MNSAVADYKITTQFNKELYALYLALKMFDQTHSSAPAKTPASPNTPAGADTQIKT